MVIKSIIGLENFKLALEWQFMNNDEATIMLKPYNIKYLMIVFLLVYLN